MRCDLYTEKIISYITQTIKIVFVEMFEINKVKLCPLLDAKKKSVCCVVFAFMLYFQDH